MKIHRKRLAWRLVDKKSIIFLRTVHVQQNGNEIRLADNAALAPLALGTMSSVHFSISTIGTAETVSHAIVAVKRLDSQVTHTKGEATSHYVTLPLLDVTFKNDSPLSSAAIVCAIVFPWTTLSLFEIVYLLCGAKNEHEACFNLNFG